MKKIVDDNRLIYKCCYLYYMDGLGQKEICDQLGISRATVSRLLKAGKENGVVRIELDNPDSILYGCLLYTSNLQGGCIHNRGGLKLCA